MPLHVRSQHASHRGVERHNPVWLLCVVACLWALRLLARLFFRARVRRNTLAFFHPHTLGGGGGERVLWVAVRAVQAACPALDVVIFTGDSAPASELASRAEALFGVPLLRPVAAVRLRLRPLVEPSAYPVLTLLGQAAGSVLLGAEALFKLTPEVFVDTSGYAFTYPLAAALGCRVAAYTHYPWVSADMRAAVSSRSQKFNNGRVVSRSAALTRAKLAYYSFLGAAYGAAGRCAAVSMANSSWTGAHVEQVWGKEPIVVFPPCDTSALASLPLARPLRPRTVVSVAQFRPEKDHAMQIDAWAMLLSRARAAAFAHPFEPLKGALLVLVGGVRNAADEARVASLRTRAESSGVGGSVIFRIGVSVSEMHSLLGSAHVALHTMKDEHFGIAVVEAMAAGAVPVAHDSAGPRADIVVAEEPGAPRPGFLASSVEGFADAMQEALCMPEERRLALAARARTAAAAFSEEVFAADLLAALAPILPR